MTDGAARADRRLRRERELRRGRAALPRGRRRPTRSTSSGTARVALETCTPDARLADDRDDRARARSSAGRGSSRRYRWHFDARALSAVRATAFDGACLRGKCDDDPALGYELMKRFAQVLDRPAAVRRGSGCWTSMATAPELRPPPEPMAPRAVRVSRARPGDRRHLDARRSSRSTGDAPRGRAGPVRDGLRLRRRRGADLGQRRAGRAGAARAHRARASARSPARSARREPGAVLGVRGPFGNGWPVAAAAGARRGRRRRRDRPRAAAAGRSCTRSSGGRDYGELVAALRRAHPRRPALSARSSSAGRGAASTST